MNLQNVVEHRKRARDFCNSNPPMVTVIQSLRVLIYCIPFQSVCFSVLVECSYCTALLANSTTTRTSAPTKSSDPHSVVVSVRHLSFCSCDTDNCVDDSTLHHTPNKSGVHTGRRRDCNPHSFQWYSGSAVKDTLGFGPCVSTVATVSDHRPFAPSAGRRSDTSNYRD